MQSGSTALKILRLVDVLAQPAPEPSWVVPNLIPSTGITLLAAAQKTCKTWLALDLALAMAPGGEFLDRPISGTGVVILEEDMPEVTTVDRLHTIAGRRGADADVWVAPSQGVKVGSWRWEAFVEVVNTIDPALVIIDTLSRINPGSENDAAAITEVMGEVARLVNNRRAVLLLHHLAKPTEFARSAQDRVRGSSAITASVDAILTITAAEDGVLRLESQSRVAEPEVVHLRVDTSTGASWEVPSPADTRPDRIIEVIRTSGMAGMHVTDTALERFGSEKSRLALLKALVTAGRLGTITADKNKILYYAVPELHAVA